jgi:hypothetical protein
VGASDEASDAANERQAAIIDPARKRILSNPAASMIDLAILAAHECTPEDEDALGARAPIAAVLGLAGIDPRNAMIA